VGTGTGYCAVGEVQEQSTGKVIQGFASIAIVSEVGKDCDLYLELAAGSDPDPGFDLGSEEAEQCYMIGETGSTLLKGERGTQRYFRLIQVEEAHKMNLGGWRSSWMWARRSIPLSGLVGVAGRYSRWVGM
jgi:hypothetical protein